MRGHDTTGESSRVGRLARFLAAALALASVSFFAGALDPVPHRCGSSTTTSRWPGSSDCGALLPILCCD